MRHPASKDRSCSLDNNKQHWETQGFYANAHILLVFHWHQDNRHKCAMQRIAASWPVEIFTWIPNTNLDVDAMQHWIMSVNLLKVVFFTHYFVYNLRIKRWQVKILWKLFLRFWQLNYSKVGCGTYIFSPPFPSSQPLPYLPFLSSPLCPFHFLPSSPSLPLEVGLLKFS